MKIKDVVMTLLTAGILMAGMTHGNVLFADERGERHERGERSEREGQYSVVENPLYKQECSSCHFLYLPGLLPARSWEEIIKNSGRHFGEDLSLEEKTKEEILAYLAKYSAEKTDTEWSRKILNSIGSGTPTRITETPYISRKHREVRPEVFKRPSIGSFSNCGACHPGGAKGDFEEEGVKIPKQ